PSPPCSTNLKTARSQTRSADAAAPACTPRLLRHENNAHRATAQRAPCASLSAIAPCDEPAYVSAGAPRKTAPSAAGTSRIRALAMATRESPRRSTRRATGPATTAGILPECLAALPDIAAKTPPDAAAENKAQRSESHRLPTARSLHPCARGRRLAPLPTPAARPVPAAKTPCPNPSAVPIGPTGRTASLQ